MALQAPTHVEVRNLHRC